MNRQSTTTTKKSKPKANPKPKAKSTRTRTKKQKGGEGFKNVAQLAEAVNTLPHTNRLNIFIYTDAPASASEPIPYKNDRIEDILEVLAVYAKTDGLDDFQKAFKVFLHKSSSIYGGPGLFMLLDDIKILLRSKPHTIVLGIDNTHDEPTYVIKTVGANGTGYTMQRCFESLGDS